MQRPSLFCITGAFAKLWKSFYTTKALPERGRSQIFHCGWKRSGRYFERSAKMKLWALWRLSRKLGRGEVVKMLCLWQIKHNLVVARRCEDALELIPRVDIHHTKPMAMKCSGVDEIETYAMLTKSSAPCWPTYWWPYVDSAPSQTHFWPRTSDFSIFRANKNHP